MNSRPKVKPRIGDLCSILRSLESEDKAKAKILNYFFAGVFTAEDTGTIPELPMHIAGPRLADITISSLVVKQKL